MKGRTFVIFVVFLAGVAVGAMLRVIPVVAQGGGAEETEPIVNGDVNGDLDINLTDAIYILRYLFQGGDPPLPCTCDQTPGSKAPIRFLNNVSCGGVSFSARLTMCDTSVDQLTSASWSMCRDATAGASCQAKVYASTNCGVLCFNADINVEEGHIYSFVLSVDEVIGPFVIWFDQVGDCATVSPPTPDDLPVGQMTACGAGAGGEAPAGQFAGMSGGAWNP